MKNHLSIFSTKLFLINMDWVRKKLIQNPEVKKGPDPGSESAALLKIRFRGKGELI
jgi:hypothetical protein